MFSIVYSAKVGESLVSLCRHITENITRITVSVFEG